MAKVSEKARAIYLSKIKDYKKSIQEIQLSEKELQLQLRKNEAKANYIRLKLSDMTLNIVSYYTVMNSLSVSMLGVKNESFLNDARKSCYKAIIILEEIFTSYIDVPYHDYEDRVKTIQAFPELDRFKMIRKLGFSIMQIKDGFGENSKWKWSFVELQARMATLSRNCINMKRFVTGMDPHEDGYSHRVHYYRLMKGLLQEAAENYRRKYELSTRRIDDFKKAIDYLGGLRRLSVLMNEPGEAEALKKKIDVWRHKMNTDHKKQEQDSRLKRINS